MFPFESAEGVREFKVHVFLGDMGVLDGGVVTLPEESDDGLDEVFGGGGTVGEEEGLNADEPIVVDFGDVIDEIGADAAILGGLSWTCEL